MRKVSKTYHALVRGRPEGEEGLVEAPVDGYPASSSWRLEETFPKGPSCPCLCASLIEVRPQQGRKHQVRAHLDWLASPILLDPIYTAAGGYFFACLPFSCFSAYFGSVSRCLPRVARAVSLVF